MSELASYQHVTPPLRVFSGATCFAHADKELARLGVNRAVIFCGNTLGQAGSPLDALKEALGSRLAGVFTGVKAHSPVPDVEAAMQMLRDVGADGAIAVGGGSAIVTARAASILLAEGKPASELATAIAPDGKVFSPRLNAPKIPQIIVPTTPTTAIVKAGSAVFDPVGKARLPMFDPKTRAQSVFIHAAMLDSAPDGLVISASLNTLAMAVEGLMARNGDPIADGQLMQALRLSLGGLERDGRNPGTTTRGDLVVAAMLCGQGTDHTGAGIVTVLGHAIGVPFHVENGIANAVVLPHAIAFNAPQAQAGLVKVAAAMGLAVASPDALVGAIQNRLAAVLEPLGVASRLRDLAIPQGALAGIATHAMGDWFLRANPRKISGAAEIEDFLGNAW